jgi:hypothetical protein
MATAARGFIVRLPWWPCAVSGFEYRTVSFLPPDLDVPATLSTAEWLGLTLWYSAVCSRRCVCGALDALQGRRQL